MVEMLRILLGFFSLHIAEVPMEAPEMQRQIKASYFWITNHLPLRFCKSSPGQGTREPLGASLGDLWDTGWHSVIIVCPSHLGGLWGCLPGEMGKEIWVKSLGGEEWYEMICVGYA